MKMQAPRRDNATLPNRARSPPVTLIHSYHTRNRSGLGGARLAGQSDARRYDVMPKRSRPNALIALPRISRYRSRSSSPALSQMSWAVSLECGNVLSACG